MHFIDLIHTNIGLRRHSLEKGVCTSAIALLVGFITPSSVQSQTTIIVSPGHIDLIGDDYTPVVRTDLPKRFLWSPQLNTLFVGSSPDTFQSNSLALFGTAQEDSIALGGYADSSGVVLGFGSVANLSSLAAGRSSKATGQYAVALGDNSEALSECSTSVGASARATAAYSLAIGTGTGASGMGSAAIGFATATGEGAFATAWGYAFGDHSIAIGESAASYAFGSIALGVRPVTDRRRDGTDIDPAILHPKDPLLSVGNGSPNTSGNALKVYRDGVAHFAGEVRAKPAGDISMGSFTQGPGYAP